MSTLRSDAGKCQSGRARTHYSDGLFLCYRQVIEHRFVTGAGIQKTGSQLAAKGMIQASLVAGNTDVDFVRPPLCRLVDELSIRQQWPCHRNHVRIAIGKHLLRHRCRIDPVGRDQRYTHFAFKFVSNPAETSTRHHGGDCRNTCFVPAYARVDYACAGCFNGLRLCNDFIPGISVRHHVQHRQAVYDNKFRSNGFTDTTNYFHCNTVTIGRHTTPLITSFVNPWRGKFVDEIALGPHHLDTIVARLPGQLCRPDKTADLPLDPTF